MSLSIDSWVVYEHQQPKYAPRYVATRFEMGRGGLRQTEQLGREELIDLYTAMRLDGFMRLADGEDSPWVMGCRVVETWMREA